MGNGLLAFFWRGFPGEKNKRPAKWRVFFFSRGGPLRSLGVTWNSRQAAQHHGRLHRAGGLAPASVDFGCLKTPPFRLATIFGLDPFRLATWIGEAVNRRSCRKPGGLPKTCDDGILFCTRNARCIAPLRATETGLPLLGAFFRPVPDLRPEEHSYGRFAHMCLPNGSNVIFFVSSLRATFQLKGLLVWPLDCCCHVVLPGLSKPLPDPDEKNRLEGARFG